MRAVSSESRACREVHIDSMLRYPASRIGMARRTILGKHGACAVQNFALSTRNGIEGSVYAAKEAPVPGLRVFLQRKGTTKTVEKRPRLATWERSASRKSSPASSRSS